MTYKITIISLLLAIVASISGCINLISGNYIEEEKLSLLRENQTTRTEVIEIIGKPDYINPGKDGKGEFFSYYYSREGIFTEKKRQTVSLFIDDTGILREITVSEKLPE